MRIKLVIAVESADECGILADYFSSLESFQVVASVCDGAACCEAVESYKPDAVVMDLILPRLDAYGILKSIKGTAKNLCAIVLSSITGDKYLKQAIELGADYYMLKPCDPLVIKERIQNFLSIDSAAQTFKAEKKRLPRCLDEKISNIFISVGIPAHIKGYQFLREAVKLAIDRPEIINSITKQLYPDVARHFETSASKVERAIRHAIEVAWNRGKIENINNLFGIRIYNSHEKPTNGEFIALVADKLLIETIA